MMHTATDNPHITGYHFYVHTIWPKNLTGIKFDEIAFKLYFKNMMDFNLMK